MKIQALAALNKQEELKDFSYESASLSENDCIVKVHTCGICHSDIHMIDNVLTGSHSCIAECGIYSYAGTEKW